MSDNSAGAVAFADDFDPIAFFEGRTLGHAVVRGPGGRVIRRCQIETDGRPQVAFDALHFDELYTFDDGSPTDLMHWAVKRSSEAAFEASELSVLGPVRSELNGTEWRIRFRRKMKPPSDGPTLLYDVRFSQVMPDVVMKTVRLALLGMPVAVLSGFHRRIERTR